jgi:hypothetical protein
MKNDKRYPRLIRFLIVAVFLGFVSLPVMDIITQSWIELIFLISVGGIGWILAEYI